MSEAIFQPGDRDGLFIPTELSRGPWDPNAQHGGAPAALMARAIERVESALPMQVARITYEFLKPVPLVPLELSCEVVRPGKRVQLVAVSLAADGAEVCRALGLRIRRQSVEAPPLSKALPIAGPDSGAPIEFPVDMDRMFSTHGMEVRFTEGAWNVPGPATGWFRMQVPLIAGERPSPLQRVATAADFPNGLSAEVSWHEHLFVNPDMTLYLEREPVGEWVGLDAVTRLGPDGAGVSEAVLYDKGGRIGRSLQALYFDRR